MNKQWTPDPNATYVTLFDNPVDPNGKKPERSGTIKFPADCSHLEGQEMEINLWRRVGQSGKQFFSGTVKPKWTPDGAAPSAPRAAAPRQQQEAPAPRARGSVDIDF
jgi:hypothetical protein